MENQQQRPCRVDLAESDTQIMECLLILQEMRPHLRSNGFLRQFRELQRTDRYHLAALMTTTRLEGHNNDNNKSVVMAVAGFCIQRNLAFGRHLMLQG